MGWVLSIDVGTTNLKAALVDEDGALAGTAQQLAMPVETDASGRAEHDPDRLLAGVLEVCRHALGNRGHEVDLLALTSYQFGLVLLGRDGRPLTQISTFADTAAQAHFPHYLAAAGDAQQRYVETGCPPLFQYPVNRLHRLATLDPALPARTGCVADSKAFLLHALTGNFCSDYSTANSLGCLNVDGRWNAQIIAATGFAIEHFPEVVDGFTARLPLTDRVCDELGLRRATPVAAGLYDGAALAAALSGFEPGIAIANFGTSGMFRIPTTAPITDIETGLINSCLLKPDLYFCGSGINNSTMATNWLLKLLDRPVDFIRDQDLSVPGAHGVMSFPYFTGERDRGIGNVGTGIVLGLGLNTTREDLARSFLEGVAFSYALIKQRLEAHGAIRELRLGGGGSANLRWMQIIADMLNLPIGVTGHPEMGIVGAAALARHADSPTLRAQADGAMSHATWLQPDPSTAAAYREQTRRYFAVRAALATPLQTLAHIRAKPSG